MPGRRRSMDSMERDYEAADLFRQGLTYRQISAQMGWNSPSAAFEAVRRAARDAGRDSLAAEEALRMMLERLQDYRRMVYKVATAKHYVTTQSGKIVEHPVTGMPLLDDAPVLNAVDRLMRADQEEAKLLGLYAPVKSRVDVITEDMVDAECRQLMREIAENDRAAASDSRSTA